MSKKYPKMLADRLEWIGSQKLARSSKRIDRRKLARSFGLVVKIIESGGDQEDEPVRQVFRKAGLRCEDPFHWWELLHAFCSVHSRRPTSRLWTEEEKRRLLKDAVAVGRPGMSILKICRELKTLKPREWRQTAENLHAQITRFGLTQEIHRRIKAKR